jgi:aryl-alcohol dehydrogenase-like predicted oxidoreductase
LPLAGALLSGSYRRNVPPEPGSRGAIRPTFKTWDTDRNWSVQEGLAAFAAQRGWPLAAARFSELPLHSGRASAVECAARGH